MPIVALTPFIGPRQDAARLELVAAIRELLDAPAATVEPSRDGSPKNDVPTRIVVRQDAAMLTLLVREGTGAWQAGPLAFTVEREPDGRPVHGIAKGWLRRLAVFFTEIPAAERAARGATLAKVHHRWATVASIDDRDYRHVEHAHSGPTAFLRPTFRCNQDCHFCWEGRDWPEPSEDLVSKWMDELAATGAREITLCGGEPTINRRLPELVARASHRYGMRVHMNTNAIALREPAYARLLVESGLSSLLVSFHSSDPAVSDAMTGAPGTWRRTVAGIDSALDVGLRVIINCVVEQANVEGLAAHASFVRARFVDGHPANPVRMVNYSQPGKYYDGRIFVDQIVPLDVARPHVTAAARILHEAGVLLEILGSCGFPGCVAFEIPDIVAWRRVATVDAHHASARVHDPEPCRECAAREHCVGPRREYIAKWGTRGLVPFTRLPTSDWYARVAAAGLGDHWASTEAPRQD